MIVTIPDPEGLDLYVQRLQQFMYDKLAAIWPSSVVHNSYGRCSRNQKNGGFVAELYDPATKNDYRDVYYDDSADVVSFFGMSGTVNDKTRQNANLHLIVFCDVRKLKPTIGYRADDLVRRDYLRLLGKCCYGFHLLSTETGLDNVLRDYRGSLSALRKADMQPLHVFRLNFLLSYNPNLVPLKL